MDRFAHILNAEWSKHQTRYRQRPKRARITPAIKSVMLELHAEGYTKPEIASRLGISESTVYKHLTEAHRAREAFYRARLAPIITGYTQLQES